MCCIWYLSFYSSFLSCLQSCVAAFVDVVIGGRAVETPPMSSMNLLEGLSRTVVYITHNQLLALVSSLAIDVQMNHEYYKTAKLHHMHSLQ